MSGLEFLRFSKAPEDFATASPSTDEGIHAGFAPSAGRQPIVAASALPVAPAVDDFAASVKSFISGFRILTSSADTNARINRTWASIVGFDPHQYADKFEVQAAENLGSMSKWLRDLQNAVSKPKA